MNKSRLIIAITTMVVIVACIVFFSLAWFKFNSLTVGTDGISVSPDDPTFFTIGDVQTIQNSGNYKGETGLAFYRYVETPTGDFNYIYVDDGIYETRASVAQVTLRASMRYFPYTIAEPIAFANESMLYYCVADTGVVSLATAAQLAAAKRIYIDVNDELVYPTVEQLNIGLDLKYWDGENEPTDATEEQLAARLNLYYGTIVYASNDQLVAGRYLYVQDGNSYVPAESAQIDAAQRVLHYDGDVDDMPTYSKATPAQIQERLALRYGESETVATVAQLQGGEGIKYFDGSEYSDATAEQIAAALDLFYKDDDQLLTKDFRIYSFTAEEKQENTYYWKKGQNANGDYIAKTRYEAEVSAQMSTSYSRGDLMYFEIYRQTNGNTVYTVYDSNKIDRYRNWGDNSNATISKLTGSDTTYRVTISTTIWLTITLSSDIVESYEIYYVEDSSGVDYELKLDHLEDNALTLYSLEGSTRKQQYKSTANNQSVVFNRTPTTYGEVNYAGSVDCVRRKGFAEGQCRTVQYTNDSQTNYVANNKDYILICTGTEGNYTYRVLRNNTAQTALFSSVNENTTIEVRTNVITCYAIEDATGMEDEVYTVSKQFNIAFPANTYDHYVKVVADKIGIVPLHDDAANTLAQTEGVTAQEVYYTYVDNNTVDFGLDYVIYGLGTSTEVTYVTNYDGTRQTQITALYADYSSATHGNLTYITEAGYLLYVESGSEYEQIHTGMENMGTLAELQAALLAETVTLYVKNGSTYLTYSERFGDINYATVTINNSRLYYYGDYPVATMAQITAGVGLYYWTGSAYAEVTTDILHASGLLYYSANGLGTDCEVASSQQIKKGIRLYYCENDTYYSISSADVAANRKELYYHNAATIAEIDEGAGLCYWDGSAYHLATTNMVHASGTLYYGNEGVVATAEQITEGTNLYYGHIDDEGNMQYTAISGDIVAANRRSLYKILYNEASVEQIARGQNLIIRSVTNTVWNVVNGQRTTVLYSSDSHAISTTFRTMYCLPTDALFNDFYVEVDIYNITDDIMVGTFYPDETGRLTRTFDTDDYYVMDATDQLIGYRCVIRVYFLDGRSYNLLRSDTELTYKYDYSAATPMYVVSDYGSIRAFTYSDDKYIGSNFMLRLNIATEDIHD